MDKLFLIIISALHLTVADVQTQLNLTYLKPVTTLSLADAQLVADHISIGQQGDKIFIVSNNLVFNFYDKHPSAFESQVEQAFPNADIAVLTLNSTVNLYGYTLISHGRRLRVQSGADQILYVNEGQKLAEETQAGSEALFTVEELQDLKEKHTKSEVKAITANEAGVHTVPLLLERYFGKGTAVKQAFDTIKVTEYQ